jgi:hypothetical protein
VNPAAARALVPPRPNLGPEPWSEPDPFALFYVLGATAAALFILWLGWRRHGRFRVSRVVSGLSSQNPRDTSPHGRLVALSQSFRTVLASQFGPAWRAKTNEELSAEPRLAELLGGDQLQELIQILNDIDLLKFAPNRSNLQQESLEQQLAVWEPRLAELGRQIQATPARRPRNGSPKPGPPNSRRQKSRAGPSNAIMNK